MAFIFISENQNRASTLKKALTIKRLRRIIARMNTQEAPQFTDPAVVEAQMDPAAFEQQFAFEMSTEGVQAQQEMLAQEAAHSQEELPGMNPQLLEMFLRADPNSEFSQALSKFMVADLVVRTAVHYGYNDLAFQAAQDYETYELHHNPKNKKKELVTV
jgi:hypothetical protein